MPETNENEVVETEPLKPETLETEANESSDWLGLKASYLPPQKHYS